MMRSLLLLGAMLGAIGCGATARVHVSSVPEEERARLETLAPIECALAQRAEQDAAANAQVSDDVAEEQDAVARAYWEAAREEAARRELVVLREALEPRVTELHAARVAREEEQARVAEQARLDEARALALREAEQAIARAEREETRARRRYATNEADGARHAAEVLIARVNALIAARRANGATQAQLAQHEQAITAARTLLATDPGRALREVDRVRRLLE